MSQIEGVCLTCQKKKAWKIITIKQCHMGSNVGFHKVPWRMLLVYLQQERTYLCLIWPPTKRLIWIRTQLWTPLYMPIPGNVSSGFLETVGVQFIKPFSCPLGWPHWHESVIYHYTPESNFVGFQDSEGECISTRRISLKPHPALPCHQPTIQPFLDVWSGQVTSNLQASASSCKVRIIMPLQTLREKYMLALILMVK